MAIFDHLSLLGHIYVSFLQHSYANKYVNFHFYGLCGLNPICWLFLLILTQGGLPSLILDDFGIHIQSNCKLELGLELDTELIQPLEEFCDAEGGSGDWECNYSYRQNLKINLGICCCKRFLEKKITGPQGLLAFFPPSLCLLLIFVY